MPVEEREIVGEDCIAAALPADRDKKAVHGVAEPASPGFAHPVGHPDVVIAVDARGQGIIQHLPIPLGQRLTGEEAQGKGAVVGFKFRQAHLFRLCCRSKIFLFHAKKATRRR